MLILFLMMFGLVMFVLAGLGLPEAPKFKYLGWGLASVTLAFLLATGPALFKNENLFH